MSIKMRNAANNGWHNVGTIKIRNAANNGWHLVNTGKIRNAANNGWHTFYQRITTTAPTVSETTVGYDAITWTVTQASTTQFAEFPSQFQYYIVRPNGTRFPTTGYSYTDARVATISITSLSQDQTVSLYYRLMYEDDTAGDNSDNSYYPDDETYILKETTTDAVTAVPPGITTSGITTSSITWNIDRNGANYYAWYLYKNNTGAPVMSDATSVETSFATGGLSLDTSYTLRVTSYFTDYGAFLTASANKTESTAVYVPTPPAAPAITRTARGYNYITFNYTLYGDRVYYQVGTTPGGTDIANTYSDAGGSFTFSDLTPSTSATTYYTRARNFSYDGGYSAWTSFSDSTIGFTAPSVTFASQGTSPYGKTLTWNLNNGSGTDLSYELRRGSTPITSGTTTSSTYSYSPVTTGQTYTLFYRTRITALSNPDFWAPTYAEGTYINWPGVSRTVT